MMLRFSFLCLLLVSGLHHHASRAAAEDAQEPRPSRLTREELLLNQNRYRILREKELRRCYVLPTFSDKENAEDFERVTGPNRYDQISYTYSYQAEVTIAIYYEDRLRGRIERLVEPEPITENLQELFTISEQHGNEFDLGKLIKRFIRQKGAFACKK